MIPGATGLRSAILSVSNDDSDENPYTFSIQGTGTSGATGPEIDVSGNGSTIVSGDLTPSLADHTNFGAQTVSSGFVERTFTIANTGSGTLTLGANAVSLSSINAADFSVVSQPASSIAASSSSEFTLRFDPRAAGLRQAIVSVANDDTNESPFVFTVSGNGERNTNQSDQIDFNVSWANTSILKDSNDRLAIAYSEYNTSAFPAVRELKLWIDDGLGGGVAGDYLRNGSEIRSIDSLGTTIYSAFLGETSDGYLAISFQRSNDYDLFMWIDDGLGNGIAGDGIHNGGELRLIDPNYTYGTGEFTLDDSGNIALAYIDDGDLELWLDDGSGGGTAGDGIINGSEVRTLDSSSDNTRNPSIVRTPEGYLAVSFRQYSPDRLNLWIDDGAGFGIAGDGTVNGTEIKNIPLPADVSVYSTSLEITPEDRLILGFTTTGNESGGPSPSLSFWLDDGAGGGTAGDTIANGSEVRSEISLTHDQGNVAQNLDLHWDANGRLIIAHGNTGNGLWIDDGRDGGTAGDYIINGGEARADKRGTTPGTWSSVTLSADGLVAFSFVDHPGNHIGLFIEQEAEVTGNGVAIEDGDTSPDSLDYTDFGAQTVASGTVERTFTISNLGTHDLYLAEGSGEEGGTLAEPVTISGPNASDFTVVSQPYPVVEGRSSRTFTVSFDPSAAGLRTATASFGQVTPYDGMDSDENPYSFAMQGTGGSGVPEIEVSGNSVAIADGDVTPDAADDTDFGSHDVAADSVSKTYTITNSGASALTLGSNAVSVSGVNSGDYTVTSQPSTTVASGGGTTAFTIEFDPSASGVRSATVNVANDDSDESPYNFAIEGTGTVSGLPEIDVTGNGSLIADGDTTPSAADHTDFGNQDVATGSVSRTFTIENSGSSTLTLGSNAVSVSGADSGDFAVTSQPAVTVVASGSTTFTIEFDPSAAGLRSASVGIANDDSDESPYDFAIQGTGDTGGASNGPKVIDSPNDVGRHTATTYDANGYLAVSFYDVTNRDLRLWIDDGLGGGIAGNSQRESGEVRLIESADTVGQDTDIHLMPSGHLAISHDAFNGSNGAHVRVWIDDGNGGGTAGDGISNGTETRVLESDAGNESSVATDANGYLAVAYPKHVLDGEFEFRLWLDDGRSGGTAGNRLVDGGEIRTVSDLVYGAGGRLLLDDSNFLTFIYPGYEGGTYVWRDDGNGGGVAQDGLNNGAETRFLETFEIRTPASPIVLPGGRLAAAIDGRFAGGAAANSGVSLWIDDGLGSGIADNFRIEPAEIREIAVTSTSNQQPTYAELVQLSGGELGISYYDHANNELRFWLDDGDGGGTAGDFQANGTEIRILDDAADVGEFNSIIAGANGQVFIHYYDRTNGDLKQYAGTFGAAAGSSPEIDVAGNGVSIPDGDISPNLADHTDFGSRDVSSGPIFRTFTISNSGSGPLVLGGNAVSISGANSSEFTVIIQPAVTVAASGSTTFTVEFHPSASGLRSATISIASDDADESPYDFVIQGSGTTGGSGPEIEVEGNSVAIVDEDVTPSLSDHSSFGTRNVGTPGATSRTFTISNVGSSVLTLGANAVTIIGLDRADFTVASQPTSSVAAASSTTFTVSWDPHFEGLRRAEIVINSDDADESPFNFVIQGISENDPLASVIEERNFLGFGHSGGATDASGNYAAGYTAQQSTPFLSDAKIWVDDGLEGGIAGNNIREYSEIRTVSNMWEAAFDLDIITDSNGRLVVGLR